MPVTFVFLWISFVIFQIMLPTLKGCFKNQIRYHIIVNVTLNFEITLQQKSKPAKILHDRIFLSSRGLERWLHFSQHVNMLTMYIDWLYITDTVINPESQRGKVPVALGAYSRVGKNTCTTVTLSHIRNYNRGNAECATETQRRA